MNIKHIVLLCLINCTATVNSTEIEEVIQVETDTPYRSGYSLDDIISWSEQLAMVKIKDPSKLLTSPAETFLRYVKIVLVCKNEWSPNFVFDLIGQNYQRNWPSVLSGTQLQNDDMKRLLEEYNCRRVPGFHRGNRGEAVIVFAADNPYMPAQFIGYPGFLLLLSPGALHYINFGDYQYLEDDLKPVEITAWEMLLTLPDVYLVESVERILRRKKWPRVLVEAIVGRYNQNSWPSGVTVTQSQNDEMEKCIIENYKCSGYVYRLIPGFLSDNLEQAVIVFASDNEHMPSVMTSKPGFLLIFKNGAFPTHISYKNHVLTQMGIPCPIQ